MCLAPNTILSSPPSGPGNKRKAPTGEKYYDELPADSGDDYSLSPLVIVRYLRMTDRSGGNGSMNIHLLYQQYWYFKNGDVSF